MSRGMSDLPKTQPAGALESLLQDASTSKTSIPSSLSGHAEVDKILELYTQHCNSDDEGHIRWQIMSTAERDRIVDIVSQEEDFKYKGLSKYWSYCEKYKAWLRLYAEHGPQPISRQHWPVSILTKCERDTVDQWYTEKDKQRLHSMISPIKSHHDRFSTSDHSSEALSPATLSSALGLTPPEVRYGNTTGDTPSKTISASKSIETQTAADFDTKCDIAEESPAVTNSEEI